ncbi:MAG: formate/nitrite transporter family protein [Desulfovibrio sp.]|jgi:formate/nitrite transporter|nr:formate/nitrite transporter family protein [Desulfovibrio sp.]
MSAFKTPREICLFVSELGIKKASSSSPVLVALGVLAGAFIAFAAEGSNMAAFNLLADPSTYGMGRCLAGVVFPTGLMLVLLAGGELFTGNTLMAISLARKKITLGGMVRNWTLVYLGNFLGSILVAHMMVGSGLFGSGANMLGGVTIKIASGKVSLSFLSAFYLGILCNWLVCLAVWICFGAMDMAGKILGIFCPIWLFITSGFEHSVANMYYIPAGIMAKANAAWATASGLSPEKLDALTWGAFVVNNLVPVTLGNIVGGAVFVGLAYWYACLGAEERCGA